VDATSPILFLFLPLDVVLHEFDIFVDHHVDQFEIIQIRDEIIRDSILDRFFQSDEYLWRTGSFAITARYLQR